MGIGKKILIIAGIILLVLIIAGGVIYYNITSSKTVRAQLHVEAGEVLVNGNAVTGDVLLRQGDSIETNSDGKATVILYESIVINLESNSKITLSDLTKEHPEISQESGETWNQFTKLAGVKEYSVTYGNSVASVRGTAFALRQNKIITGEGEVEYELDGKNYRVIKNRVIEKLNDEIEERNASSEELADLDKKFERAIRELKRLRQKEIEKHPRLFEMIKKQLNLGDEGINKALEDADAGNMDVDELVDKSPIKLESLNKIAEITKKIQEINRERNKNR